MGARPELDISTCWEVTGISDPGAFLQFLLKAAPSGSKWLLLGVQREGLQDKLADIPGAVVKRRRLLGLIETGPEAEVPVDATTISQLLDLAAQFEPSDVLEQHIIADGKPILVSYDNLTCCWVAMGLGRDELERAQNSVGFQLEQEHAV